MKNTNKKDSGDKENREAVREVSRNLCHNCENVTISHYLP